MNSTRTVAVIIHAVFPVSNLDSSTGSLVVTSSVITILASADDD